MLDEERKIENNKTKENCNKKKIIIIISAIISLFLVIGVLSFVFYPRIKLIGENKITLKLNDVYRELGYSAKIAFKNIDSNIKVDSNLDTSKPGEYKIVYSVKEGLFTTKATRIVEVIDDVAPVIELKGDHEVSICPNSKYSEEGYSATDNYDGDITNKVKVLEEDNLITYTIEDSSKNKTVEKRTIIREDKEKPKIVLNGQSTKYVLLNNNYVEEGVTVTDNCDNDLEKKLVINGTVNTKQAGTYELKYEVSDSNNNKSSVTRKVIVYKKASIDNGSGVKGTIYLTFDDGPSSSITPKVLKILKEKGVKATFFVINKSSNLNYLIKQEYNEGHTVGLHSYSHNYKTIYSSANAYFEDLEKISKKVESITGVESKIMRFPGGASNTISKSYSKGIMTYLTNEVIARGYHYFDWNVSSGDAGGSRNSSDVYNSVVNNLSLNRANIVLMHDFENNNKTLNALSDIIDYGLANGYKFLPIDMTTPLITHKVNN